MDFIIDPEIEKLLNPLTKEEYAKLEASIAKDGCRDAGVVAVMPDGKRILADGHNRACICADFNIDFRTVDLTFKDRESLILWVIDNQFARRNLTEERKAYYRGKEYLETRKTVGKPNSEIVSELGDTAKKIADKHGVTDRTVRNDADFAEAVDALPEPEKEIVLSGKSGKPKKAIAAGEKPILCDRCERTGAVKDCERCVEARKATKKKKKKEPEVTPPVVEAEPEPEAAMVDGNGISWADKAPKALIAIKAAKPFDEFARQLSKMAKTIADDESLRLYTYSMQSVVSSLRNVRTTLLDALPAYVCPYCDGSTRTVDGAEKGKMCEVCQRQGWVAKSTYKRSPKGAAK